VSEIIVKLQKRHISQELIMQTKRRFNVLKCGRRFGKTSIAKELIIEPALDGFPVAYFCPTYKDLNDFWIDIVKILGDAIKQKNEQLKQIRLITGGVIDMWSLDEPDSGRGRKYKRVVIDECEKAKKLKTAWNGTIRATLTDYIGDCWFLSTPQFGKTYFKELFKRSTDEKYNHEWQGWKFTTYDNPFMDAQEIDSAKATLDPMYFNCEYLAEDVTLDTMLWAYAFEPNKHLQKVDILKNLEIILSFDFNKNPISCSVLQIPSFDTIRVIETIKLANSDIYELCDVIKTKYGNTLYLVTGDASGSSTSAMVQDNMNYYKIIRAKLNLSNNQMMVPVVNPRLADNRVLVNSLLSRGNVLLDKDNTKPLQFDFENVTVLPDGSIKKADRNDPAQQSDALDTFRYACNTFCSKFLIRD
jgi:hypothetical protein